MKSLAPLVLIALAIVVFFLYIKPQYEKIGVLRDLIAEDEKVLKEAEDLMVTHNQLANNYNALVSSPTNMDRLVKALPDKVNNVQLTLDLDTIAAKYGGRISKVAVTESQTGPVMDAAVAASAYQEQNMTFSVSMTYDNLLKYLADIERSLRLVDVVGMQFMPVANVYQYQVTLKTYWLQ